MNSGFVNAEIPMILSVTTHYATTVNKLVRRTNVSSEAELIVRLNNNEGYPMIRYFIVFVVDFLYHQATAAGEDVVTLLQE